MALKSAEIYEPFLKKNVIGNILDQVDNYQYNLKLYMIPPIAGPSGTQRQTNESSGSADVRETTPSASKSGSGGGYTNGSLTASPSDTVVLAQTGVTSTQIDNLEIVSAKGPSGGPEVSKISFDITQPGAADFLDQIMAAKAYLGDKVIAGDVPLFLEIVFKGYSADIKDEDAGGEPILAAGPYIYMLTISTVSLEIDDAGSTYAFTCVPVNRAAYADPTFKMPKKMESIGLSIPAHVADLVQKLNDHALLNYDSYQIQDEIAIDISGLTAGKNALKDLSMTAPDAARAEEINRIMNPELEGKKESEYNAILEESAKDEGKLDIVVSENKITVREGVSLSTYIATLLSMNDEFFNRTTRSVDAADPTNTEVNKDQPTVDWFKLNAHVEYIGFDRKRSVYAKKITIKPTIVKKSGDNGGNRAEENRQLSAKDIRARVNGLPIFKAYHYLYTGLNDQIKNCKIEYKNGIALLMPPAGGMSGDFSTVMSKTLSTTADPTEDLTGQDLATAAVKTANTKDQAAALDELFSDTSEERAGDIKSIADLLGFSAAEAKDAINNRKGENARIIKETLANKASAESLRNAQVSNANKTSNVPKDYTPTLSGYVYAADIIGSVSERIDTAVGVANAGTAAAANRANAKDKSNDDSSPAQPVLVGSMPNEAEDATYNGTPRNTVFGYIMQQHGATDFMVNLDMDVKGDPWFLGPPTDATRENLTGAEISNKETDKTGIRYEGDDAYILFDCQTPRLFDFKEDEDENTGYWSKMGTAYFITGVYMFIGSTASFSGGEFTTSLRLTKLSTADAKKLEQDAAPAATDNDDATDANQSTMSGGAPLTDAEATKLAEEFNANQNDARAANRPGPRGGT